MAERPYLHRFLVDRGISESEVARVCGVTQQSVSWWCRGRGRISVMSAKLIASEYGIPRYLLRPDLWDPPAIQPQPELQAAG